MEASMRLRTATALLACALAATSCLAIDAQSQRAEGSFSRTLTVSGPVDLDVQTGSGDIEVRIGEAGTVQVQARIRAWALNGSDAMERVREVEADPPVEQSGNTIRLGLRRDGRWDWNQVSISYLVTVPSDTRLRTRTGSGDQLLPGVQGDVDASSGSGELRIGNVGGSVRATAGSGDITVAGSVGGVEARTGSGDVVVSGAGAGRTGIGTGSGDVRVTGVRGPLSLHTASGSIEVEGTPTAPWNVAASSGDITVVMNGSPAFDLVASSSSGRIESDAPVTVSGRLSRRALRGQVRGGGPPVAISTSSGSIQIR
jgi:DUF4097 and DUF4098 domain-containing protein YvlB